jgi:branched-chain amino acid transport system permease protein
MVIQSIINSIMLGLSYVLLASGLSLVFGVVQILNFAHGQMYMLSAMFLWFLTVGVFPNYFLAAAISVIVIAILGMIYEKMLLRPFADIFLAQLGIVIGLQFLFEGFAEVTWGPADQKVLSSVPGNVKIWGAVISWEKVVVIVASIIVIFSLYYWIQRTKSGRAARATVQDRTMTDLVGVNRDRLWSLVMGIGCALAAIAGVLLAPVYLVNPYMGGMPLLKSLIVLMLGGLGSILGTAIAGIMLGFIDGFGYAYLGGVTDLIGFGLMFLILLIRPQGFLGVPLEIRL